MTLVILTICSALSVIVLVFLSRSFHRKKMLRATQKWGRLLEKHVYFFETLDANLQSRFSERVAEFIETYPIKGFDTEVNDLDRLYVAASAIMPTMGFESWSYRGLKGVFIVDGALPNENRDNLVSGQVSSHDGRCLVTLSRQALYVGFENIQDKRNVGVHEFAHVLDQLDGEIDGIPSLCMSREVRDAWTGVVKDEILKIQKRHSSIDEYGGTDEVEFFAVVSEYFFENPKRLKQDHPQVYELLEQTFRQNLWESFKQLLPKPEPKLKIGRNSLCPCGSGKKFKHCCLHKKFNDLNA